VQDVERDPGRAGDDSMPGRPDSVQAGDDQIYGEE
jgi:hypothetical protein